MRWANKLDEGGMYRAPADHQPELEPDPWSTEVYPAPDGPAPPAGWQATSYVEPFEENVLYKRWRRRVVEGDANDFVVAISASPKHTGVSGTGKTTLALSLAQDYFDVSESGFDAETQATLNASELGRMYRENERGSALIFDEAQGVTASAGVNSRRSMATSTIDAIGTVAANRMRAMTLIIVSQNIKWLDKNLLDLVDAWIRITREPTDPNGPEATAYELYTSDMDFESRTTKTPALTNLRWSDISDRDPDYRALEQLKEEATSLTENDPAEQEIPTEVRNEQIKRLNEAGLPQQAVAEAFDITQSRVSQIANDD